VLPSAPDADDRQHWRDRAAQMRALAVKMAGSEAAILVNDLATDYERPAERAKSAPMGKSRDRLASRASGVGFAGADRPYSVVVQATCEVLICAVGHNTDAEARIFLQRVVQMGASYESDGSS
jgi:hypothetical protein